MTGKYDIFIFLIILSWIMSFRSDSDTHFPDGKFYVYKVVETEKKLKGGYFAHKSINIAPMLKLRPHPYFTRTTKEKSIFVCPYSVILHIDLPHCSLMSRSHNNVNTIWLLGMAMNRLQSLILNFIIGTNRTYSMLKCHSEIFH